MQSLDVISVNLWSILISLCNLLILFLLVKHLLYKPVQKAMAQRRQALEEEKQQTQADRQAAAEERRLYEEQMASAKAEGDRLLKIATQQADVRAESIVAQARERADGIVREAQSQAQLEQKKAQDGIRREIVDVSALLATKMLGREINAADHRALIDTAIAEIGEDDDGQQ